MARKKKAASKATAAKRTQKAARKAKAGKPRAARKKTARKPKARNSVVIVKKPVRKRKSKKNVTKATAKELMKNVDNIKKISMDDVKNYIADIDVLDKLEELLLSLEKEIAVRLRKQKIVKKITKKMS